MNVLNDFFDRMLDSVLRWFGAFDSGAPELPQQVAIPAELNSQEGWK